MDPQLVNLDEPVEVREFELGRFELYRVDSRVVGDGLYVSLHIVGGEDYASG